MAKLTVDQKTVKELFIDKKSDFLIPDYQRPYAWSEEECLTLWEDIFDFAFPEYDPEKFNSENEYYLGPIVTYKNKENKLEIIDGQQRMTSTFQAMRSKNAVSTWSDQKKAIKRFYYLDIEKALNTAASNINISRNTMEITKRNVLHNIEEAENMKNEIALKHNIY